MNEKEEKCMAITSHLWDSLIELKVLHPEDINEHRRDIHNIQNRIAARVHFKNKLKQ